VSDFEILQHFSGNGGGDADDGGDSEDGNDSGSAFDADGDHEQGGDDQGAEGESADRIVGGADHADQVSGDGGEEEAEDDHDDGGDDGSDDDLGEEEVEGDHGAEDDGESEKDDLGAEIFFITQRGLFLLSGLLEIADGSLDSDAERLAHFEERVGSADEHSADGDGTDDGEPDSVGDGGPIDGGSGGCGVGCDLRAEEVGEERDHESPGEQASGKVEGGEAGSDDVADAEVGGADGRSAEGSCAAGGDEWSVGTATEFQSSGKSGDVDEEFLAGVEDVQGSGKEDGGTDTHVGEEDFGGA
jgi:hypothetical protein